MVDITTIKRDTKAEVEGIRVPFDVLPGVVFIIARMWNPRFIKRRDELIGPHKAAFKARNMPAEMIDEINDRAFAETILVGWEGIEEPNADGALVPMQYSHDKAFEYMHDPGYSDIRNFVLFHSEKAQAYLASSRREALGNSLHSSSGTGSTDPTSSPSSDPG